MTVSSYKEFRENVQSQASSITVHQLAIAAPGPGKVIAFVTSELFCASPATSQGYDCASSGPTAGYYRLTTEVLGAADAPATDYSYFYLTPNATEAVSRQSSFDVAAAGNVTVYLRAKMGSVGQLAMSRTTLTLVYVPS